MIALFYSYSKRRAKRRANRSEQKHKNYEKNEKGRVTMKAERKNFAHNAISVSFSRSAHKTIIHQNKTMAIIYV